MQEIIRNAGLIPGLGRFPNDTMATHSIILAWRIPWTDKRGWLCSIGLQSQTRLKQLSTQARMHSPMFG